MLNRIVIQLGVWLAVAAAPGFTQCSFPTVGTGRVLTYIIDPMVTKTDTVLHVTLRFQGGPGGREALEVPSEWAGETLHGLINIRALSADTVIADTPSPETKVLTHRPSQELVIAYDVVKGWTGRFRHPAEFHGALLPEYIELTGDNFLIHPKVSAETRVTVRFDWQKLPARWVLATSFGTTAYSDGRCQSYSGAWRAVQLALFTAGEFRVHHFRIGARPAVLAVRGQWTFSDEEAIAGIQKAVGACAPILE